ncbi:hypothetical protein XBI1_1090036 [Xenorhabdus bovienii str. Intermedium]|uniref:Uncharacterized protein n=1 Tax=Xenorhabdus bovienii str. Intermedium TaxID=1379677 RepID=A0A077QEW7_XENBV|nr:hypothetical protein XBI1_1090036 [Xenorhabdus bovienii str. Intermedium]
MCCTIVNLSGFNYEINNEHTINITALDYRAQPELDINMILKKNFVHLLERMPDQ